MYNFYEAPEHLNGYFQIFVLFTLPIYKLSQPFSLYVTQPFWLESLDFPLWLYAWISHLRFFLLFFQYLVLDLSINRLLPSSKMDVFSSFVINIIKNKNGLRWFLHILWLISVHYDLLIKLDSYLVFKYLNYLKREIITISFFFWKKT